MVFDFIFYKSLKTLTHKLAENYQKLHTVYALQREAVNLLNFVYTITKIAH